MKPDILIFFSDQHGPQYTGFGGHEVVKTPNLDKIASQGTFFDDAYTSCPLCVPARVSFLTSQLPSKTEVFTNNGCIPEDQSTFLHMLVLEGYETVLCGRMHFLGKDQRHGFTKRIMTDITCDNWGSRPRMHEELKEYAGTLCAKHCLNVIGGGNSPVLEYDREVINHAISYLQEPHDKPQCIVVGTYAPHFPYVAPKEDYDSYLNLADKPKSLENQEVFKHGAIEHKHEKASIEKIKQVRAAYYGMISNLDRQIGQIYEQYQKYLTAQNREGIFVYMSDHGDQVGEKDLYGKQTFFEGSSRIPLIFQGVNIPKGKCVQGPVSIMDVGITLCDMVGAKLPLESDGLSLMRIMQDSQGDPGREYVFSEFVETVQGKPVPCRMIRTNRYKLISYSGYEEEDLLYDLKEDPFELINLAKNEMYSDILKKLQSILIADWDVNKVKADFIRHQNHHKVLEEVGLLIKADGVERWRIPEHAVVIPQGN